MTEGVFNFNLNIHGARRGELSPPLLVLDIHGASPPPLHRVESRNDEVLDPRGHGHPLLSHFDVAEGIYT